MNTALARLEDLPLERGQRVLVRVDFNVPLRNGAVTDDLRITTALPTIEWLLERGARVVGCGHLGRPKGEPDPRYTMAPVAARLGELLGFAVPLAPGVVGPDVQAVLDGVGEGRMALLENLRFEPGETKNDPELARGLVEGCDAYVNEAFGSSHRAHASIVGPPAVVPSAGGRLLHREVEVLSRLLDGAARPFVAVLGGAKISGKLDVIEELLPKVDGTRTLAELIHLAQRPEHAVYGALYGLVALKILDRT